MGEIKAKVSMDNKGVVKVDISAEIDLVARAKEFVAKTDNPYDDKFVAGVEMMSKMMPEKEYVLVEKSIDV